MAGMIVLGAMAAFGLISVLWALLGWLLPGGSGAVLVCWGDPDEGIRCRVKWLQSLGLLSSPLLIVSETEEPFLQNGMEYCSPEQLCIRLKQERNRVYGTGNGDPSGNRSGGGLPEL